MEAISVENIKCGGCANGIEQALLAINGVEKVIVDIEAGLVSCELSTENNQDAILDVVKQKLLSMGYPEVGKVAGLKAAGAKAKSYVSCAVGKMTDSSSKDRK